MPLPFPSSFPGQLVTSQWYGDYFSLCPCPLACFKTQNHHGWNLEPYSCGHFWCPQLSTPRSQPCPSASKLPGCLSPPGCSAALGLACHTGVCASLLWCLHFSAVVLHCVPGTARNLTLHEEQSPPVAFLQAEEHHTTSLQKNKDATCFY